MSIALVVLLQLASPRFASSFVVAPLKQIKHSHKSELRGLSSLSTNALSATTTEKTVVSNVINQANNGSSETTKNTAVRLSVNNKETNNARIIFPGGGIFFYWQAGAASYLREAGYDLSSVRMSGASAGALVATLTLTDVDFDEATRLALSLAEEAGVWERPLGLQGVWGPMIETWLNDLLPENAVEMVDDRLSLLVTAIPSFRTDRISSFNSKEDLVKCNMASVHLPWFLDGKLTSNFRDAPHVDGSFRAKPNDYFPELNGQELSEDDDSLIILDWKADPIMKGKAKDFVTLTSKEGIWGLVERGRSHAKIMDKRGAFDGIPRL
eukprot:CAMPEP_0185735814 /NCGR_PEP_ID=MMETSP1171-20130828/26257_1 /TAXON_ID=374046 /ORGANISM="Helicotheca tamensis, Strain CCMP826" /LENGTH=324 /DNA_ID=CAMNT_0028406245 /DNA_START=121 /DNA_END=1095 /DNA_ORIENTATION=+